MSVVAFDGKSVAADRIGISAGLRSTSRKLWIVEPEIVAAVGNDEQNQSLLRWYIQGHLEEKYPAFPNDKDSSFLIVANREGVCLYSNLPLPVPVEDPFMAWGAGCDFAMGAMAMGASAEQAVAVACRFCIYCGMGIDVYHIRDLEQVPFRPLGKGGNGVMMEVHA